MTETNDDTLEIDPNLKDRLTVLASRSGRTFAELAEDILRDHAEAQERALAERADDEARWQRYLKAGRTISLQEMRERLRGNATEAARSRDGR